MRTGKVKVFAREELGADHVLASACLPFMMRAPEIDGDAYWDGGFMGNPAIFPVIYGCTSPDVIMVHLTPTERPELPTNSRAIINRMQEISFNSSLMREMRAIAFVTQLIDEGKIAGGKRMYMHLIEAEDVIRDVGRIEQDERHLEIPDPSVRDRPRARGPMACGKLRLPSAPKAPSICRRAISEPDGLELEPLEALGQADPAEHDFPINPLRPAA